MRIKGHKAYYRFISPTGEVVKGLNLRKFCEENSLNYTLMKNLRLGNSGQHKGWHAYTKKSLYHLKANDDFIINVRTKKKLSLHTPLAQLARDYSLTYKCLSELVNGKIVKYLDWVLSSTYSALYDDAIGTSQSFLKLSVDKLPDSATVCDAKEISTDTTDSRTNQKEFTAAHQACNHSSQLGQD